MCRPAGDFLPVKARPRGAKKSLSQNVISLRKHFVDLRPDHLRPDLVTFRTEMQQGGQMSLLTVPTLFMRFVTMTLSL